MFEEQNINIDFAVTTIKVHTSFQGLAWCPPQHIALTTIYVYLYPSLHQAMGYTINYTSML